MTKLKEIKSIQDKLFTLHASCKWAREVEESVQNLMQDEDTFNKVLNLKLPVYKQLKFINFVFHYYIFGCAVFNRQMDSNVSNLIFRQLELTKITREMFSQTILDKRKHPMVERTNERYFRIIDSIFNPYESWKLEKELQSELKNNNKKQEKRVKL